MRNVPSKTSPAHPSTTQRSVRFTVSDGDGGVSSVVAKTIVINDVNTAPVITGANDLNAIDEDAFNNGGTLVSGLISGWVTDADPGALSGIAVVGVDNTNGSWEFSIDGGSTWTAFGSPSTNAARLLAANPDTCVRFVPGTELERDRDRRDHVPRLGSDRRRQRRRGGSVGLGQPAGSVRYGVLRQQRRLRGVDLRLGRSRRRRFRGEREYPRRERQAASRQSGRRFVRVCLPVGRSVRARRPRR